MKNKRFTCLWVGGSNIPCFLGIEFIQKAKQTQGFEQKAQNEITITFWTTQPTKQTNKTGLEKCLKLKSVAMSLIYYRVGAFANNDIFVVDILLRSDFSNKRTSEQENAA